MRENSEREMEGGWLVGWLDFVTHHDGACDVLQGVEQEEGISCLLGRFVCHGDGREMVVEKGWSRDGCRSWRLEGNVEQVESK